MRLGRYRHFKGNDYLVLGVAHDANANTLARASAMFQAAPQLGERRVVVYVPLYEPPGIDSMAVRTLDDFNAKLCSNRWGEGMCFQPLDAEDRCPNHGHTYRQVRRFTCVEPVHDDDIGVR